MSSSPIPVSAEAAPFVPTTTPTIERANRLISVRSNPGFLDILRISQEIVQEAVDTCINYPGWDDRQMAMLAVRQKCAKEHHDRLIAKIQEAIRDGVAEQAANVNLPEKTASDVVDQGDFVRQHVLTKFSEMDESRPAGSY